MEALNANTMATSPTAAASGPEEPRIMPTAMAPSTEIRLPEQCPGEATQLDDQMKIWNGHSSAATRLRQYPAHFRGVSPLYGNDGPPIPIHGA